MREIKFRAWNKIKERMGYLDYLWNNSWYSCPSNNEAEGEGGKILWANSNESLQASFNRGDLVIMQYTGIKDKNGKGIYEGDIVEYLGHKNRVISWTPNSDHYEGWYAIKEGSLPIPVGEGSENNIIEVIGNVYENPTLTETQTKDQTKEGASS